MPDYSQLLEWLRRIPALAPWARLLPEQIETGLSPQRWGDLPRWRAALERLPALTPSSLDFGDTARIGEPGDCDDDTRALLRDALMELHPWRKGPWELFGLYLDTEWRSDWKWDRLAPHLDTLAGRAVLDVGCGNGYHCVRLHGAGAERVIGIDPSAKFVCQFAALKRYCPDIPVDVLPLGIEHMPENTGAFDTVLSLGVIYHRRDHLAHLRELMGCLRPGGQLVLETLVHPDPDHILVPEGRYARMRNVWAVAGTNRVLEWMGEVGLNDPRLVDETPTTTDEQRPTEWMHFHSLPNFLDPRDPTLTIEGHPAPRRAIFTATT